MCAGGQLRQAEIMPVGLVNDKIKRGGDDDRLLLKDIYVIYKQYCVNEGFKGFENKNDLKKALEKRE